MRSSRYSCIDCTCWSMWDGRCSHPTPDGGWPERHPDEPACNRFELELAEVELHLGRRLNCGDCTRKSGMTCTAGCNIVNVAAAGSACKCPRFTFRECRPEYLARPA